MLRLRYSNTIKILLQLLIRLCIVSVWLKARSSSTRIVSRHMSTQPCPVFRRAYQFNKHYRTLTRHYALDTNLDDVDQALVDYALIK